ncbi:3223_t:CDS:2 [Gigaspora margarita]|uniref:3223_t:CDS:1 n=1 Tax=Gigaspora margarita TaxID=4874 RepID=A0ABN7UDZ2_GIGMA|nr:3223_t:CDS:2 [Gigaspora margarita]
MGSFDKLINIQKIGKGRQLGVLIKQFQQCGQIEKSRFSNFIDVVR